MLTLRNPHSVLAALEKRPKDVQKLVLPSHREGAELGSAWAAATELAKKHGIQVTTAPKRPPEDRRPTAPGPKEGRTGSAEAWVKEREGIPVESLFAGAPNRAEGKGLWLALDNLQDPHNVGAIFRTAAFFGVQGILLTEERSAPLTGTVYDIAAGGLESVPFTIQTNLQRAFEVAKEAGLWILGTSEHAKQGLGTIEKDRPWLLVLGNEEKGMRRLTQENCDVLCAISPHAGALVTSLNVSVAAGVVISKLA